MTPKEQNIPLQMTPEQLVTAMLDSEDDMEDGLDIADKLAEAIRKTNRAFADKMDHEIKEYALSAERCPYCFHEADVYEDRRGNRTISCVRCSWEDQAV